MKRVTVAHSMCRKGRMTNLKLLVGVMILMLSMSGCATDRAMSPAPEGEKVSLSIKLPEGLEAKPMRVMYRSAICRHVTHDAHGRRETLDGYNGFDLTLRRIKSDLYEAELYVDGGGPCRWRLSNVDLGVQYSVPTFGVDATPGWGGGLIVVFDSNNPQRQISSPITVKDAVLNVIEDYYPLVSERFINGYAKQVSLVGVDGGDLTYTAPHVRKVYFEPVLHGDYVVRSIAPKKNVKGDFPKFYYPDGTVQSHWRSEADFKKMQEIRLKAEASK